MKTYLLGFMFALGVSLCISGIFIARHLRDISEAIPLVNQNKIPFSWEDKMRWHDSTIKYCRSYKRQQLITSLSYRDFTENHKVEDSIKAAESNSKMEQDYNTFCIFNDSFKSH